MNRNLNEAFAYSHFLNIASEVLVDCCYVLIKVGVIIDEFRWIRFGTVVGYIFFVSLPAVALSIYYICIWDPGYVTKVRLDSI
ncbi:unnamed protein product [Anisakis simplex]|uniref:XK-related protein n=1 Tax=Anisakis simplex TaxID=6269 RepID=A0A0M3J5Q5_ANISI|nr:unnamed protein product [Anisakis simplex]